MTEATGTGTVMTPAPLFPSLDAVTLTVPGVIAVTSPVAVTVATLGIALLNVTGRPVSVPPALSFATAVTTPDPGTVATAAFDVFHVGVTETPASASIEALSGTVWPT